MPTKVLVTGGAGFVGVNLIKSLLQEKDEVHVILRDISRAWRLKSLLKDIQVHSLDLRNEEGISTLAKALKVNRVFHLATYGGYHYERDLNSILNTNLTSTWNLFREFSKYELEMFVNTGSSSEYGEKKAPMEENMLLEPNSMYGASKACSNLLCSTFSKINKIPFVTLRLFSPYGYYDAWTRLIPTIIISSLLNRKIVLNKKTSKRDYIFIEDVSDAYICSGGMKNSFGEVFNVGSGAEYTIEEILKLACTLMGTNTQVEWKYNKERQYEPELWVSNIDKIKSSINWYPKTNIQEGLKMTIEWFRENIDFYTAP